MLSCRAGFAGPAIEPSWCSINSKLVFRAGGQLGGRGRRGLSVLFEVNQKSGVRHSRPRAKAPGSAVKLAGPPGESPASKAGGFTRVLFSVLLSLVAVFRKT